MDEHLIIHGHPEEEVEGVLVAPEWPPWSEFNPDDDSLANGWNSLLQVGNENDGDIAGMQDQLLSGTALKDDMKPVSVCAPGILPSAHSLGGDPLQSFHQTQQPIPVPLQQQQDAHNTMQNSWQLTGPVALRGHAGSSLLPGTVTQTTAAESEERANLLWGAPSSKQRLRWTPELHERFIKSVESLGGPDRATPKRILELMEVKGLEVSHVKSHLQKFRIATRIPELGTYGMHLGSYQLTALPNSPMPSPSPPLPAPVGPPPPPLSRSHRSIHKAESQKVEAASAAASGPEQGQSPRARKPSPQPKQPQQMIQPVAPPEQHQVQSRLQQQPQTPAQPQNQAQPQPQAQTQAQQGPAAEDGTPGGSMDIMEALRMQMEVQKKLHEQLEAHRRLQQSMEANLRRILEEQQRQTSSAGASDSDQSGRSATHSEQQSLLSQGQQLLQMSQRQLTQQTLTAPRLPQLDLPPPKQRKGRTVEPVEVPRTKRRKHDGAPELTAMPSERARAIANGSWGPPQVRVPKGATPLMAQPSGNYSPRTAAQQPLAVVQYAPQYAPIASQSQHPVGVPSQPHRGWPLMQQAQQHASLGQMPTPGYGAPAEEGQAPMETGYDSPRHRHSKGKLGASNLGEPLSRRSSQAGLAPDGIEGGNLHPGFSYSGLAHGGQAVPPDHPMQSGSPPGPAVDVQENPTEPGDGSEGQGDMWAQQEVHLWLNDSDQAPPAPTGPLIQWDDGGGAPSSGGSDGLGNRRRALRANA